MIIFYIFTYATMNLNMYDSLIEDKIFGKIEPEDLDKAKTDDMIQDYLDNMHDMIKLDDLDLEQASEVVDLGAYEDGLME